MLGSLCNALSSFLLLTVVTRINGSSDGGAFSIAFSTAQLMITIGNMEVRPIQSTDITEEVAFKDYFSFRVISCLFMMLGTVGYILTKDYSREKAALVFLICSYKMIESMSDVFEGLFQQKDRIDLSGMSLAIRVIVSTIAFVAALGVTHSLILASVALALVSLLVMILFDVLLTKDLAVIGFRLEFTVLGRILKECFPLFVGTFMMNYMINAPKYAIDRYYTDEIQNYYGFLFMPAFAVNLLGLFIFRPMLVTLAVKWKENKIKEYTGMIQKVSGMLGVVTVFVCLGTYLLGIPVLNLVSGLKLDAYRTDLVLIMLGGGISALVTIFYYAITVMRKQYMVLCAYAAGFLTTCLITPKLVEHFAIRGASIAYMVPTLVIVLVMLGVLEVQVRRKKKGEYKGIER